MWKTPLAVCVSVPASRQDGGGPICICMTASLKCTVQCSEPSPLDDGTQGSPWAWVVVDKVKAKASRDSRRTDRQQTTRVTFMVKLLSYGSRRTSQAETDSGNYLYIILPIKYRLVSHLIHLGNPIFLKLVSLQVNPLSVFIEWVLLWKRILSYTYSQIPMGLPIYMMKRATRNLR
jgi:hypothetical protein